MDAAYWSDSCWYCCLIKMFGLQLGKFEATNWFSPEDSPTFREDSGWKFLGDAMTLIADNRSWNLSKVRSGRRCQLRRGGTLTPWGVEWSWLECVEDHVRVDLEIQDLWKPYLFVWKVDWEGLKIPKFFAFAIDFHSFSWFFEFLETFFWDRHPDMVLQATTHC